MGIEPTWDSPHCPTPDLKSGSPTSELGTSGPIYNKNGVRCRLLLAESIGHGEIQLAADRGQQAAKKTRHYGLCTEHFGNFGLGILIFHFEIPVAKFEPYAPCSMLHAFLTTDNQQRTTDPVRPVALSSLLI